MLSIETPINNPSKPPHADTKSVSPTISERFDVINWFSLKKIDREAKCNLLGELIKI